MKDDKYMTVWYEWSKEEYADLKKNEVDLILLDDDYYQTKIDRKILF
jgi:hypothetical protein